MRVDVHAIATLGARRAERQGAWVRTRTGLTFHTEGQGETWRSDESPPETIVWVKEPRADLRQDLGFAVEGIRGQTVMAVDARPERQPSFALTALAAVDLGPTFALDTAILPYSFVRWLFVTCAFQGR